MLVRATIRGLSAAEAASILDHMRPRSTGLVDGLDPASAPTNLPLLGEHTKATESARTTDAYFEYGTTAPAAGKPIDLLVHTTMTYNYPGYLREWISGTGSPDGSEHFDPDIGLYLSRPDGSTIVVGPATVDRDVLERVARSVVATDQADVDAIHAELDRRLEGLPLLASADAKGVTIDLRGNDAPTTLCLHTPTSSVCAPPLSYFSNVTTAMPGWIIGSVILDGQWYVATAADAQPTLYAATSGPQPYPEVPGQVKGQLGPWFFTATVIPDGTSPAVSNDLGPSGGSFLSLLDPR